MNEKNEHLNEKQTFNVTEGKKADPCRFFGISNALPKRFPIEDNEK